MLNQLLRLRFLYLIAVLFTLLNSLFFLVAGVLRSLEGYRAYFQLWAGRPEGNPALEVLEGLDSFLVALVFLVFSLGMWKIFIRYDIESERLPGWLNIRSFKELKRLLWETILVTLVVFCIGNVVRRLDSLNWDVLILPAVVALLSVGLFFMRGKEEAAESEDKILDRR